MRAAADLARINTQAQADLATIDAQKVTTIAGVVAQVLIIGAAAAIGIIGMITLWRVLRSFAVKREHAARIPLMLPYDKKTLTLPGFVAIVDGRPVLVDPNVGAILPLAEPSKADLARARFIAAQNSIAVQAIHSGKSGERIMPLLEESEARHE